MQSIINRTWEIQNELKNVRGSDAMFEFVKNARGWHRGLVMDANGMASTGSDASVAHTHLAALENDLDRAENTVWVEVSPEEVKVMELVRKLDNDVAYKATSFVRQGLRNKVAAQLVRQDGFVAALLRGICEEGHKPCPQTTRCTFPAVRFELPGLNNEADIHLGAMDRRHAQAGSAWEAALKGAVSSGWHGFIAVEEAISLIKADRALREVEEVMNLRDRGAEVHGWAQPAWDMIHKFMASEESILGAKLVEELREFVAAGSTHWVGQLRLTDDVQAVLDAVDAEANTEDTLEKADLRCKAEKAWKAMLRELGARIERTGWWAINDRIHAQMWACDVDVDAASAAIAEIDAKNAKAV